MVHGAREELSDFGMLTLSAALSVCLVKACTAEDLGFSAASFDVAISKASLEAAAFAWACPGTSTDLAEPTAPRLLAGHRCRLVDERAMTAGSTHSLTYAVSYNKLGQMARGRRTQTSAGGNLCINWAFLAGVSWGCPRLSFVLPVREIHA